ncbi:MAG TPA: AAA family ATPase [Thermoplasmata archaeon]|nr:AAA family ATPase [Thermoplasmata archaeon]
MAATSRAPGAMPAPLIGRHQIVEDLLALTQRARSGSGRLALLEGQGGLGKTTFLRAVATMGRELDFHVIEGRSLPADLPEPFQLVRALLRSAQQDSEAREGSAPAAAPSLPMFLAPYETDTTGSAARSTGLAEPPPTAREADRLLDSLANPTERVDANRSALFAQLTEFFTRLADSGPVLLLLDDLHFADESSLEFLREFLPALAPLRLLVLASILPPSEGPARTNAAIEALALDARVSRLTLTPMSESELAEYVRWLLHGHDPGRDLVMRWFTQTEGNPLFTEYLVRASTGASRETPPTGPGMDFDALLKERVRSLPESEQRLLVYGAVIGREFDFPTVVAALGQEEERLSEALDRLVHGGILREKGGEVYEFVSERSRADVYAQLTETRRRLLHRKVAAALARRSHDQPGEVFELARQFYLGRDDAKAVEYNRRAADLSAHAYAFDTAAVHLERALESLRRLSPRDLHQEVLLLVELGRFLDELGDLHRSEEVLLDAAARARTDARQELDLALALLGLAQTRYDLSQYVSSRELATEAFKLLGRLDEPRGLLAAHRALGVANWRMGNLDDAERHQREEIALAEKHGSPVELGHALIDLANTFTLQTADRAQEAMGLYGRAAELFQKSEDHSAQARVLMNHALLLHYSNRPEESLAKMLEAVAAAERSRSRVWIGYCCLNVAQFYAERGTIDLANQNITRAQGLLEPLGDQLAHQQITMIRGMIAAESKRYEDAETLFAEALRLARTLDLNAEVAEMEMRFADLEFRRGAPDQARVRLEAARAAGIERLRADLLPKLAELEKRLGPKVPGAHR